MPRYEYRDLHPMPPAEQGFLDWIQKLDQEFSNRDFEHRCRVVRNHLHELYLGKPYADPAPNATLAEKALIHSFDPRNTTLEPEYYGDADVQKYNERKPLIWFWMMFDRSPAGLNHWLGFRVRAMLAKHIFKHFGKNVKIFHGVEFSYGYDYANVYSHEHDLNDGMIVQNTKTEIGPKARVTYHATVMSGVRVHEHGLLGSLGVATKDVPPYTISVGIPAKGVKVKTIAPAPVGSAAEHK